MSQAKKEVERSRNLAFLTTFGGAGLLVLLGIVVAYQFVQPAPPRRIAIAAGSSAGAYFHYARRYREILARDGITLEVIETAGSLENLERLTATGGVDLAIVQGGVPAPDGGEPVQSLGSVFYEPVWLLQRGELPRQLNALHGRRIGVGPEGSGTRFLALNMLHANGLDEKNAVLVSEDLETSAARLIDGDLDLMFMVTTQDSPVLRRTLASRGIVIRDLVRAAAYAHVDRSFSALTLPQGALDLESDLPGSDTDMVAVTAILVSREDLHPALVDLLIEAAAEVHGPGGLFEEPGQFPSPAHVTFRLNPEAARHYEYGPPFLQRYLPFWAATLVDRLKIMLLPLLALLLPLAKVMPPLFRWRIRRRIYRWYAQLRQVDTGLNMAESTSEQLDHYLQELDRLEREVEHVTVPLSYTDQLYNLRLHIRMIREKAIGLRESQEGV